MWRAFFLAIGAFACILGLQSLAIDKAILNVREPAVEESNNPFSDPPAPSRREVVPPPWAPWSLMSSGAVVMIYSFTIPRRGQG